MKKIKYLLLLLPFLFITSVNANEAFSNIATNGQIGQWHIPLSLQCFDSSYNSINTYWVNNYFDIGGVDGKDYYQCSVGSNGLVSFSIDQVTESNKLYSLVLFVGNNSGTSPNLPTKLGLGTDTYLARNDIVYSGGNGSLWSSRVSNKLKLQQPGEAEIGELSYYAVYVVFASNSNSTSIAIDISYPFSVGNSWIFGYSLNFIGNSSSLSSNDVQNIIDNSGLATASDVHSVMSAVKETEKNINDTLKDDNTQQAQDSAGGFFNNFTTDTHGLTAIITAPLSLISKITSASCSPLVIPLPYVDKDLTLPCMGAIYSQYFGSFLSIYQVITFGIVAYWVCVRIFNLVKDFKNPDHDEIEVLDL